MTTIRQLQVELENVAPLSIQEDYDNCGLLVGHSDTEITNILVCLDCTEAILDEALSKKCNLIVAHHPLIFKGIKKLNGSNAIERTIIKALKNNVAIYALHTNLDNLLHRGVNSKIAEKLNLQHLKILAPKTQKLAKLVTFVPLEHADELRKALFEAGAGHIGNYDSCSFNTGGTGTFKGNKKSNPFVGAKEILHTENETRIETVFPVFKQATILEALLKCHPYEEVAYDIYGLENEWPLIGSGMIGELQAAMQATDFLAMLKKAMNIEVIKFTPFNKPIKKIALCGGSGSFLLSKALQAQADVFISSDFKYHEFFDAEGRIMICDVGHYESEQFTSELIIEIIRDKFANFAPILAETNTNPVNYYY